MAPSTILILPITSPVNHDVNLPAVPRAFIAVDYVTRPCFDLRLIPFTYHPAADCINYDVTEDLMVCSESDEHLCTGRIEI